MDVTQPDVKDNTIVTFAITRYLYVQAIARLIIPSIATSHKRAVHTFFDATPIPLYPTFVFSLFNRLLVFFVSVSLN